MRLTKNIDNAGMSSRVKRSKPSKHTMFEMASKLYGVSATIIEFVIILYLSPRLLEGLPRNNQH